MPDPSVILPSGAPYSDPFPAQPRCTGCTWFASDENILTRSNDSKFRLMQPPQFGIETNSLQPNQHLLTKDVPRQHTSSPIRLARNLILSEFVQSGRTTVRELV